MKIRDIELETCDATIRGYIYHVRYHGNKLND